MEERAVSGSSVVFPHVGTKQSGRHWRCWKNGSINTTKQTHGCFVFVLFFGVVKKKIKKHLKTPRVTFVERACEVKPVPKLIPLV